MDIDTTSINELPIVHNNPASSNDEQIEQGQTSTANIMIDKESVPNMKEQKHVRFDENLVQESKTLDNDNSNMIESIKNNQYEFDNQTKLSILAALIFFLMMDPKIKKYILNILVQIFGSFLKTEHGNMTQIGIFVYSLFYFCLLMLIHKSIDISSFHLAF